MLDMKDLPDYAVQWHMFAADLGLEVEWLHKSFELYDRTWWVMGLSMDRPKSCAVVLRNKHKRGVIKLADFGLTRCGPLWIYVHSGDLQSEPLPQVAQHHLVHVD